MPTSDVLSEWISQPKVPELNLDEASIALTAFIRSNFTGPPVVAKAASADPGLLADLTVDSEPASRLVKFPQLLTAAESAFRRFQDRQGLGRALVVHQSVLANPTQTLHDEIFECYTAENIENWANNNQHKAELCAEVARAHLVYGEDSQAKEWLERAVALSGLVWRVTGVEGKNTKHQTHLASQLVCIAVSGVRATGEVSGSEKITSTNGNNEKPHNVKLDSDLLLEKPVLEPPSSLADMPVELQDIDITAQPSLTDLDCALLLFEEELQRHQNPAATDPIVAEQLRCLVRRVIDNATAPAYAISGRALWRRSALEAESVHTVERGTLQMESLVEEMGYSNADAAAPGGSEDSPVINRLGFFNILMPMPCWSLDIQLAERFMAIGSVKTAIAIYERLRLPAEAALCYAMAGREEHAINILDEHLKTTPDDAKAWAVRGDIARDPESWERSWSVGRYPAAKRALGRYYYPDDLEKSRQAFEDSLEVNSFDYDAHFMAGCVCIELRDWTAAARHFQACVAMRDEDMRSWSNLGTALLQLDKPQAALHAFRQAIRVDQNSMPSWKVWSNFVSVASQIGSWDDVLTGLGRLLALEKPPSGFGQLSALLHEVAFVFTHDHEYNIDDMQQQSFVKLICDRLPNFVVDDPTLWGLVAHVELWRHRPWAALAAHEKAYRACINSSEVVAKMDQALKILQELVDAYRTLGPQEGRIEGSKVCAEWQSKARSAVRTLMSRTKLELEDTPAYDKLLTIKEELS